MDEYKRPTAKELLDSELMQFQAQIEKTNEKKDKGENEETNQKINELELKVRQLEAEKEKERRRTDQAEQRKKVSEDEKHKMQEGQLDMEEILKKIQQFNSQEIQEITQSGWIEMKNELEKQEK
ncbi:MAG: hypothetical protein EZS28_051585 [Streblomastix strix]|uniref:Uncharacterized protein n=1 Tax=Streblomastix strix TaxID=222440 RepID=A0A5J4T313_9EUKA|nr:MAG: hypothetical protein EZS28_051585 [Streblomastix strix]